MSQEETIQQNKKRVEETAQQNILIAVFMGAEIVDAPMGKAVRLKDEYFPEADGRSYKQLSPYILKYHISWDWLKPVVDKIYKIYDEESDNWPVTPLYGDVYDPYIFFDLRITESINSVYRHVIAFINFYNQNKDKP